MLLPVLTCIILVIFMFFSMVRMRKIELKQKELEWKIESLERPMALQADSE